MKKISKPTSLEVVITKEKQNTSKIVKTLVPAYKRLLLKKEGE